jgi:hypothetical protein
MDLTTLQNHLALVNIAIEKLIQGKQLVELKVGSSSFSRQYKYTPSDMKVLTEYRKDLLEQIHALSTTAPTFRSNAVISNFVTKQIRDC